MMKRYLLFIYALLILCGSAYAETQKVTGVDQTGKIDNMTWFSSGTQTVGKVTGQTATTAGGGTCTGTVKDSQSDDNGPAENNRFVKWLSTEFQATSNYSGCTIILSMRRVGSPTYSYYGVTIFEDDGADKPNSANVLGTAVIATTSIPTSWGYPEFTFATPVTIVSGTKYHIAYRGCSDSACNSAAAEDAANYIQIAEKGSDVSGMYNNYSSNGTAWTVMASYEHRQAYFVLKQ